MKKLLLFIVLGLMFTSCVVTTRPTPTYKRYWYKPWYGPKHYNNHPPRHHRHR